MGGRLSVETGRSLRFSVEGPVSGSGATGLVSATRGGREVWQYPLLHVGGLWTARAALTEAGPHVVSVRLYQGQRVWSAAADLSVLEPGRARPEADPVREVLDFQVSSGSKGGDASGWWGIAAMLALFLAVWFGSQGWRRRPT